MLSCPWFLQTPNSGHDLGGCPFWVRFGKFQGTPTHFWINTSADPPRARERGSCCAAPATAGPSPGSLFPGAHGGRLLVAVLVWLDRGQQGFRSGCVENQTQRARKKKNKKPSQAKSCRKSQASSQRHWLNIWLPPRPKPTVSIKTLRPRPRSIPSGSNLVL